MGDQTVCGMLGLVLRKAKPFLLMVGLQCGSAGMYIISTVTLKQGMSRFVLIVYRNAIAAITIAPFALVLERPILDQNLAYLGITLTTASFASAIMNAVPAITFVIAVILRLERVKIKEVRSQAKIIGTIVTFAGALLMTFYKGPVINLIWTPTTSHFINSNDSSDRHWLTGTLCILVGCCAWSCFFILQSITVKKYPAELSLAFWICLMGTLQSTVVTLVFEHHLGVWSIGWDSRLLAPLYTGIVSSGITYYVQGLVMKTRGPVFVTAFNPLCMIIVAALGSLILAEKIHLGSIIGAIIIAVGLYAVVWGKIKDHLGRVSSTDEIGGKHELPITMTGANGDEDAQNSDIVLSKTPVLQK
ncbi:hypothetical protein F0562_002867 [Nyssa sinensis]|uniref:WAT1-related protein n=1 Tax=Nyssa sinensis TaxID=561372 RepID=A0A5J5BUT8_9ASTE|nr:hypothetical protein F0562_002867 [Nyssa sinensis]